MKVVRFPGPLQADVVEVPSPALKPGEVRVKVAYAGICGSDVHRYKGDHFLVSWPAYPGHECSGTVIEVGPGADARVGQQVAIMPMTSCGECAACRRGEYNHCLDLKVMGAHRPGGYAEEIVVSAPMLRHLPEGMTLELGALVEPTGIAVHCANRGAVRPGDRVAVLGAGSIGLLIQEVAKARGAAFILATGRGDEKLAVARDMGADEVVNVGREEVATGERSSTFDVVFDCVCEDSTIAQAIALARPGGRIVTLAVPHTGTLAIPYTAFYRKELTMSGSRLYDGDFDDAIPLVASGRVKATRIVTHRFPLVRAAEAMREVVNNRRQAIKVLLVP